MPYKFKKTNIQYDVDTPEEGYIVMGFDEQGNLVTKNSEGLYQPIINDITTGNFDRLEVNILTVGNRVAGINEGQYSIAQGENISASGNTSFASGNRVSASGLYSYARGVDVSSTGKNSYASGIGGNATGKVISEGKNSFVHMSITAGGLSAGVIADDSAILGGQNHDIGTSAIRSVILGGNNNTVNASTSNSVILGGSDQVADQSDTVYLPKMILKNTTSPLTENGAIYYDGSGFWGYNGGTAIRLDVETNLFLTQSGANRLVTAPSAQSLVGQSELTWNGTTLGVGISGGKSIVVNGTGNLTGNLTAANFIRNGGTASQFLKANGSVDSTSYNPTIGTNSDIDTSSAQVINVISLTNGVITAPITTRNLTPANIGAQPTITGGATTITSSNLTADRALISSSTGKVAVSSTITSTELGYLNGATSNIQSQISQNLDLIDDKGEIQTIATSSPLSGGGSSGTVTISISSSPSFSGNVTAANFVLSSDIRLKENIKPITNNEIDSVELKEFNFISDESKRKRYGVIAQELEKIHPEMVYTNDEGFKEVGYIEFLIKKVHSLENRIIELEKINR